jgi:excisionase family DNA binding protein
MAVITIAEAARQTGRSRQTLYRAIKAGELSTSTLPDGSRGIDTAELLRVYGTLGEASTQATVGHAGTPLSHGVHPDVQALHDRLARVERELDRAHDREARLMGLIEAQARTLERLALPAPGDDRQGAGSPGEPETVQAPPPAAGPVEPEDVQEPAPSPDAAMPEEPPPESSTPVTSWWARILGRSGQ